MISKINLSFKNLILTVLVIQIFIYLTIFNSSLNYINLNLNLLYADFASYSNFDFSSLELILSQHRTFGFPLLLKIYRFFDYELIFWTKFIFILYSISNIFLLYSLIKFNFSRIFSFFFVLALILSNSLYVYINQWTELTSISFLIISLGFMFLSLKENRNLYYFLFSLFLFFTYQIRASFVLFVFIPIIFCLLMHIIFKKKVFLKKILFFSMFPLISFIILRFLLVGSLSLVSFNGGWSASALIFLEDQQIPKLKIENQEIAKKFLERKRKLPYPCNLDYGEEQIQNYKGPKKFGQYPCWNDYAMSNWLELIKINLNIEPFATNDSRNINPWIHLPSLANFWQKNEVIKKNVEIDGQFLAFSKNVYELNYKKVFKKLIKTPINFVKLQRDVNGLLIILFIFLILPLVFIINKFDENNNSSYKELSLFLSFVIITFGSFLVLYAHQNGDPRAVIVQTFYLIPILLSFLGHLIYRNLNAKIKL